MDLYAGLASQAAYDVPMVPQPLPRTDQPVHILGKQYSSRYDYDELLRDVTSRLWMTYRRGYAPIGGVGPTCDQGWGCMLRCGQMMLAQALVVHHLGRDWRWSEVSRIGSTYRRILRLFEDSKSSCYSIHQITAMGVSEGKAVGQWFGPNTIAHVLKKLSVFDEWSNLEVHVAMDSTIVINEIRAQCKLSKRVDDLSPEVVADRKKCHVSGEACQGNSACGSSCARNTVADARDDEAATRRQSARRHGIPEFSGSSPPNTRAAARVPCFDEHPLSSAVTGVCLSDRVGDATTAATVTASGAPGGQGKRRMHAEEQPRRECETWRPLLLVVPLRLGLSELNDTYCDGIKMCLEVEQSIGIIGGSPNHALWFIGYFGDDVIFLDPHTTQPVVSLDQSSDDSYHCRTPGFMKLRNIDPSLALGFFCRNESEFDDLCTKLSTEMKKKSPMFEICNERHHWHHQPVRQKRVSASHRASQSFTMVDDKIYDSDEYEIIDSPTNEGLPP